MKTDLLETNSRSDERGAISIKALLGLSIAAVAVFTLIKFVPVYVEQQQLIHEVDELARTAAVRGWRDDRIALDVKRLRSEYSLPDDSINFVSKDRRVQVVVGYKRDIDLLLTSFTWQVDYTANGKEL
ncbi:MAG: hypothetical protein WAU45_16615 [Blastocatellia bacterium]